MSWSITTGISPQDSTRMSHVPGSPDIQTGNRFSPPCWCFVAKVPWLPRYPMIRQGNGFLRPWDPHDFFSELIMGIMRSTVMGHMGHMGHMYSHLGSWILDDIGLLEGRALPSPISRTTWKFQRKKRSIPKRGRSPRGVDPHQEISRIPKVLAQHPMVNHYLPCWN